MSCPALSPVLDFSDPFSTEVKPRILLMGLRRSGKSSIQKVVFHKMSPSETLFLESTNKICREDVSNSSFVNFQIWDFPGQIDFFDPTFDYEMIFRGTGALIFVIDSQVRRVSPQAAPTSLHTCACHVHMQVCVSMCVPWPVCVFLCVCTCVRVHACVCMHRRGQRALSRVFSPAPCAQVVRPELS